MSTTVKERAVELWFALETINVEKTARLQELLDEARKLITKMRSGRRRQKQHQLRWALRRACRDAVAHWHWARDLPAPPGPDLDEIGRLQRRRLP